MVIQYDEILNIITTLGDNENLRITAKRSIKGGLIGGVIMTVTALMLGPPGFLIGGVVGGLVAYNTSDSFKPISSVILEMEPADQRSLVDSVTNVIENLTPMDALTLLPLIHGSPVLKAQIVGEITSFCQQQLNLKVLS